MSEHLTDEIPRLLTGDATRDEVLIAAAHLRSCPDCQQELVSAVVAHASLTSARRFAPEMVAADGVGPAEEPAGPLPDLSAVFAQARAEADARPAAPRAHPRRRLRLAAVAAAAAVVVGGGTAAIVATTSSSSAPATTVALQAFQAGRQPATAKIVGPTMRIDASQLPRLDRSHFYEVWLTDARRTRMQSLGAIGNDNRAELTVPLNVMAHYSAIEVSVQKTTQTDYSGVSVLRGSYG